MLTELVAQHLCETEGNYALNPATLQFRQQRQTTTKRGFIGKMVSFCNENEKNLNTNNELIALPVAKETHLTLRMRILISG